jgi:hypothetical protein
MSAMITGVRLSSQRVQTTGYGPRPITNSLERTECLPRPRDSHTTRLCVEETSCLSGTRCLDENILSSERSRCIRLFRDDNLDTAFSPQYVDADILRMTFKREVNGRVSNPEILNFDMLQERRQGWL